MPRAAGYEAAAEAVEAAASRAFGSRLRQDPAVAGLRVVEGPAAADAAAGLTTAVGTLHGCEAMLDGGGLRPGVRTGEQQRQEQQRGLYGLREPRVAAVAAAPRALALSPDAARKVPSGTWVCAGGTLRLVG